MKLSMRHLLLSSALLLMPFTSSADEKVVWDKAPIKVILKPNTEKMVVFPSNSVRVKIPAALSGSLTTLSNNGVIYWEATEEFTDKRILVQDVKSQKTIVVHLSSDETLGTDEQITVLLKKPDEPVQQGSNTPEQSQITYGYEELTRVAAKHLYAPERLVDVPEGMHRVNVTQQSDDYLIRGHIIEMTPVISFTNAGLYITAVKLVNKQHEKVLLDPRDIRGQWLAATFQHSLLGPNGDLTDTTAVYLVSDRPFWESF